jgi:hypothetical protein
MRTAIDMDRRAFLAACAALLVTPNLSRAASGGASVRLAAAWQGDAGYQVGVLEQRDDLRIQSAINVPTRAHALLQEPGGTLLAVARRPGDWLLRWDSTGKPLAWCWIEPRRAFTGHVVSDGKTLFVAETDLDTGLGLIGVRDAVTLEKRAEWPTHGIDPHQLLWDAHRPGALIVANGGVPTQPETGRAKLALERMDSSLVRIDAATGELLGQWRLDDRRLSLRHLAWNGDRLGIALQAEHDAPDAKAAAPVLAVFDGEALRPVAAPQTLAGYGGDVAPIRTPVGDGFAVSCPRAQGIALFSADGVWQGLIPLAEACALAASADQVWGGGRAGMLALLGSVPLQAAAVPQIRLDNHWINLRG